MTLLGLAGWPIAGLALTWSLAAARSGAMRRETVARASHELRGPITAARLGIALMLRGGELSMAALRAIDLELSRAGLALEDFASVREAQDSPAKFSSVDVPQLLADCVEASRASAYARGTAIELRWTGGVTRTWGDRVRLAQAARNLIANAVEHGGGGVVVSGRGDATSIRIEVTDGGDGLPAPVAELVRRPSAGRGDRGRGLAIAAGIAERHGGRLAAAPSDRGARLVLELPSATDSGWVAGDG